MRSAVILSPLAVVLAASVATVSAQSPPIPAPPQFTAILTGQFNATYQDETAGPFGTRVHLEASGGSLLNVTTGEVVANITSFSNNGVTSDSGARYPSAMMPLTWSGDGHFASVTMEGVGDATSDVAWTYAHVETDSPTYSWMNGKFFIAQVDSTNLPTLTVTMYEETS